MRFSQNSIRCVCFAALLALVGCSDEPNTPGTDPPDATADAGRDTDQTSGTDVGLADAADMDSLSPDRRIAWDVLKPFFDEGWIQSVSLAVVRGDEVEYMGFGQLAPDDPRPPSPDSIYEIGSVTKPLTGTLLATYLEDGTLTEETLLKDVLPAGSTVPTSGATEINLLHLATHRAGLPAYPDDLPTFQRLKSDPDYTDADLLAWLAGRNLMREPGLGYTYSNAGTALMGIALAEQGGDTYEALLRSRVLEPLGMTSTGVSYAAEETANVAPPLWEDFQPSELRNTTILTAAGSVHSSARDLVNLVQAHFDPDHAMADVLARTRGPHGDRGGTKKIGLYWQITGDGLDWFHLGVSPAYRAQVSFRPTEEFAVIFLMNTPIYMDPQIYNAIYYRLLEQPWDAPMPLPTGTLEDPDTFNDWVGEYTTPGPSFEVQRESDRFYVNVPEQKLVMRLFPAPEENVFYTRRFPGRITASKNANGVPELKGTFMGGDFIGTKQQ
jgi:CubicO group peptidase (beta-lactamase class C family)